MLQLTKGQKYMSAKSRKKQSFENAVETSPSFHIQPKTYSQQYLLDCIENDILTIAIGPAGTGKTYCSAMKATQLYLKGDYENIILTRPNVPTGRSLGHFPGSVEDKMTPWLKPVLTVLEKGLGKGRFEYMLAKGIIQIQPIETIRGQSFENSIILCDESQNLIISEIKAMTTRIGEGSKMILMGDPNQNDVGNSDALNDFADLCFKYNIPVPVVRFGMTDIVRSDITAQLCKAFLQAGI